ncbi:alpha/beta hydrolase [Nocardia sp. NPDC057440]|uniref:alpha/beta hydrolase n=1 Tax=Nocardia sp. NPDC057440 TaxID=3346134 RepID=UPI00366F6172
MFFDGVGGRVHYRIWPVHNPRAVVVFLHGLRQQSADYHRFGRALGRRDIEVWALDHPGHGLSEGDPDTLAPITDLAANARLLVARARSAHPEPLALMGHSLGAGAGVIALQSNTEEMQSLSATILCGTPRDVATRNIDIPNLPTLLLHGDDDRIAPIEPIREWARARGNIDMREFAGAGHDLLHEQRHGDATEAVINFVLDTTRSAIGAGGATEVDREYEDPEWAGRQLGNTAAVARGH